MNVHSKPRRFSWGRQSLGGSVLTVCSTVTRHRDACTAAGARPAVPSTTTSQTCITASNHKQTVRGIPGADAWDRRSSHEIERVAAAFQ